MVLKTRHNMRKVKQTSRPRVIALQPTESFTMIGVQTAEIHLPQNHSNVPLTGISGLGNFWHAAAL